MKNRKTISILIALFVIISMLSPMLAEASTPKGSLTIHKLYFPNEMGSTIDASGEVQTLPADVVALKGAEFTIWKVEDDAEIPYTPSGAGTSIITGTDGEAFFGGLLYGRYYIVETGIPKGVTQKSDPFMVDIPTTVVGESDDLLTDNVHVYPKNVLTLGAVEFTKHRDDGEKVLQGAIFDLYKDGQLYLSDLTTDANGKIFVGDLEIGEYYFIETFTPDPYLLRTLQKPFTIAAGDHAYADNELISWQVKQVFLNNFKKPGEFVKEANVSNAGIGDKVTWTIKNALPEDIGRYTQYKISDMLDLALNYDNNVKITINGTDLVEGINFTLVEPNIGESGLLEIIFIIDTLNGGQTGRVSGGDIVITFDTIVNEKAKAGTDLKNQAILEYNNAFISGKDESNTANIEVGAHKFKKIDNKSGKTIKDAQFIIKREDGKYLAKAANGMISWGSKAGANKFTTGTDGMINVNGLAYGNYFLVETKAPAGYSKLTNPVTFTVSKGSHTTILDIMNKAKPKPGMPQTGGTGTMLSTAIGLAFIALAAKVYKKDDKQTH